MQEPTGREIHHRQYHVRAFAEAADRLRLRGEVRDTKPPGLYFEGDPDPLDVHHMVLDLVLDFPSLTIVEADAEMFVTPHLDCVGIQPRYGDLVGVSIARGFNRKVNELFGAASGCTHITALLRAMAPVAVQSMWSMRTIYPDTSDSWRQAETKEDKLAGMKFNLNSCHMWAEDGRLVTSILDGDGIEIPVWAERRIEALGYDGDHPFSGR